MDYMMPVMDGVETVKKIRETGYNNTIFALTASAFNKQQEFFLTNGFDGFIAKPIDMHQLNDLLNKFIRDKQPPEKIEAARKKEYTEFVPKSKNNIDFNIEGINSEIGLELYDGETSIYIGALRTYANSALGVIKKMQNVSEESLADYVITVHGLKGISSAIGAEKIRTMAGDLERMAQTGDLNGVLTQNKTLINSVEDLVLGIQTWMKEHNQKNHLSSKGDK
jgi:CheY-like chemotaxis protein